MITIILLLSSLIVVYIILARFASLKGKKCLFFASYSYHSIMSADLEVKHCNLFFVCEIVILIDFCLNIDVTDGSLTL